VFLCVACCSLSLPSKTALLHPLPGLSDQTGWVLFHVSCFITVVIHAPSSVVSPSSSSSSPSSSAASSSVAPPPRVLLRVLRCKDRLNSPKSSGYRDILLNVCDVESGFVAELQLNFVKIAQINCQSHRFYELIRVMDIKWAAPPPVHTHPVACPGKIQRQNASARVELSEV